MTTTTTSITRATTSIPSLFRFLITTIEPGFAIGGTLTVLLNPSQYVTALSRNTVSYAADTQFIYTTLAGAWLCFAFNELIVLRFVDDLWIWRMLCAGMLLSDACYCHSVAQAVGGWAVWVRLGEWTVEDWVVFVTTAPFLIVRVLIVCGFWGSGRGGVAQRQGKVT